MYHRVGLVSLLLFGLLLSACASVQQAYTPEPGTPLRSIAVLTVPEPLAGLGMPEIRNAGLDFSREMTGALSKALRAAGYRVSVVNAPRAAGNEFVKDYAALAVGDADAILDTRTISVMYTIGEVNVRGIFEKRARPNVHIHTRLVSVRSGKILYAEMVTLFGDDIHVNGGKLAAPWKTQSPERHSIQMPRNPDGSYPSPLTDAKTRTRAVAGLRAGLDPIAAHVAGRFKP